jgi:RNA polymerase sigma factor (sigma-70 family)
MPPNLPIAPIVQRAQSGDLQAFTDLVQRFQDMAVGYAFSVLGDFHRAEDAAQEAFVQVLRDVPDLHQPAAFAGWLRRIVYKHCDRQIRRAKLTTIPLEDNMGTQYTADPHQTLEAAEDAAVVHRAINILPEHQRQTITLFYIGQHSQADIAAFLDISVGAVGKRLYDARKNLKEVVLDMVKDTLRQDAPSRDEKFTAKVLSSALPLHVTMVPALAKDDTLDLGTTAVGRTVEIPQESDTWFVEPLVPLDDQAWDRLLGEMKERGIPGLRAGGHLTDRHLKRIGELGQNLEYLDLSGTHTGITDAGLSHLAGLPHLRYLNLNLNDACNAPALVPAQISDAGMNFLAELNQLEVLYLHNLFQVGDQTARHWRHMKRLRRLGFDATLIGNEGLKNIAGHPHLAAISLGPLVDDQGLNVLGDLPAFHTQTHPTASLSLGKCPLVGDKGLTQIAQLKGLYELGLCQSRLMSNNWVNHLPLKIADRASYSAQGITHLQRLENLKTIVVSGELLNDDALIALGGFPALSEFSAGEACAGQRGWEGLAQSQSLEHLDIFSSHGLTASGIKAFSRLPQLSSLGVGSQRLDDEDLAPLAEFETLRRFSVGRGNVFTAAAFAHIARIPHLEQVSMSYVHTLGDDATKHLIQAPHLRILSLTDWQMSDQSCQMLVEAPALEELDLSVRRVTDAGLAALNRCTHLKRLRIDGCPFVTDQGVTALRNDIEITYKPGSIGDFIQAINQDESLLDAAIEAIEHLGTAARPALETALAHAPKSTRPIFRRLLESLKSA